MVVFYKKWKKYNEIQLTKNKTPLNIRKMTNHLMDTKTSLIHSFYWLKTLNKRLYENLLCMGSVRYQNLDFKC